MMQEKAIFRNGAGIEARPGPGTRTRDQDQDQG